MRILLVEDDSALVAGLTRVLRSHEMAVDALTNGADVMRRTDLDDFSIFILDIGLPGLNGFELVRLLRERGHATPIILLTARDAVSDRVRGLEAGADDYLVKPFDTSELVARIKAMLRRANPEKPQASAGRIVLDRFTRRAWVGGLEIELSVREWAVLEYLIQQTGRVVSKQQIIDAILPWGAEMSENAVEVYVSRIRQKTDDALVRIRTIRGFGYLLEQANP